MITATWYRRHDKQWVAIRSTDGMHSLGISKFHMECWWKRNGMYNAMRYW